MASRIYGVQPVGLDVAERSIAQAKQWGVEAYHTTLENAPEHLDSFPLITAIDLVEHVVDAEGFLYALRSRLAVGGVAYLETPNIQSWVYRVGRWLSKATGGRPRAAIERLFPPQHIQYFTPLGFETLARRCGLEVAWLEKRRLPYRDLAVSRLVGIGLAGLQWLDWLCRTPILLCAVLRRTS
jgi:hypothetical protein